MPVESRTEVQDKGVLYEVVVDGRVEWQKFVPFGPDKAHRSGGPAFKEASREQDREAARRTGPYFHVQGVQATAVPELAGEEGPPPRGAQAQEGSRS